MPPSEIPGPESESAEADSSLATARASDRPARGRFGCAPAFVVVFLILALLAGFVVYRMERMAEKGASGLVNWGGRVRDAIVAVTGMQPRVTVNEQVVFEQAQPVLELAVLERDTTVERETETQWMGSTRRLRIRGLYHVKAGYDLTKNFTVNVSGNSAEVVRLQMASPRVLTVELKHLDVLTMENGLWNHLSKEEMESEINTLTLEAHQKSQRNGTPAEAQRMFIDQLQEKLGPGHRIEIVTPTPAVTPTAPK